MGVASGSYHWEAGYAAGSLGTVASAGFMQSTKPQTDLWGLHNIPK